MDENSMTLVVFYEDPFFVGVIERVCEGRLTAARHVFGAEPKDAEVYAWVLQNHFADELSPAVGAARRTRHESPKRAKRDAGRHLAREGVGTRSQQALALSRGKAKTGAKDALARAKGTGGGAPIRAQTAETEGKAQGQVTAPVLLGEAGAFCRAGRFLC